ncbi:MAG: nucleotidyl transferase AbiEii/AbiGii toxin family protein [Caldilineaceae bacterium SB0662_bin_9]|uniref:Nucleotidyl transferase AbiEii/AbiGii toxin family protein n=1 Tax=Caldilineaceae bacterium SB0662_bin_9 TaxID=2605258 RepID=A0A6B1DRN0_9CHLR|nr:nucleotidyl transferase AbiEii/AbiGii toxin family protein [Caldilineaceae bacterium SB0662_bin_9]
MRFSASQILSIARPDGFDAGMIEKVLHLVHLLNNLNSHPSLRGKWALKGGTALNLFVLRHPRLSIDIDLNYIGALEREEMLADRPKIERAIQAVFSREGFSVRRVPEEHAGGKWRLHYSSFTGQTANLDMDLNFMYRCPLWPIHHADSHPLGDFQAKSIPVLNLHELVAGKLSALFSRRQARDLFDCHHILAKDILDRDRLRIAFVVYGGMNRKDWRTISLDDVAYDGTELVRQLGPTLRSPQLRGQEALAFGNALIDECRQALSIVLPFTNSERSFLDLLLEQGEINASILTSDPALQERIRVQPLLVWKAFHVRHHRGLS